MGRRSPIGRHQGADDVEVEQSGVGWRKIASDEDERSVRFWDTRCGNTENVRDNTVRNITEVTGALRHVSPGRLKYLREAGKRLKH